MSHQDRVDKATRELREQIKSKTRPEYAESWPKLVTEVYKVLAKQHEDGVDEPLWKFDSTPKLSEFGSWTVKANIFRLHSKEDGLTFLQGYSE